MLELFLYQLWKKDKIWALTVNKWKSSIVVFTLMRMPFHIHRGTRVFQFRFDTEINWLKSDSVVWKNYREIQKQLKKIIIIFISWHKLSVFHLVFRSFNNASILSFILIMISCYHLTLISFHSTFLYYWFLSFAVINWHRIIVSWKKVVIVLRDRWNKRIK